MSSKEIPNVLQRAAIASFDVIKYLTVVICLFVGGLFVAFTTLLAANAGTWISIALYGTAAIVVASVLFLAGLVLGTFREGGAVTLKNLFQTSGKYAVGVVTVAFPALLLFLLIWLALGLFIGLSHAPIIGPFVSTVFLFAPFFMGIAFFTFPILIWVGLFFLTPYLFEGKPTWEGVKDRLAMTWGRDVSESLRLFLLASFPTFVITALVIAAAWFAFSVCPTCGEMSESLRLFSLIIPIAGLIALPMLFFYQVAYVKWRG